MKIEGAQIYNSAEMYCSLDQSWILLQWFLARGDEPVAAFIVGEKIVPAHIERRNDGCLWVVPHSRGIHGFQYNGFMDSRGKRVAIAQSAIAEIAAQFAQYKEKSKLVGVQEDESMCAESDFSIFDTRFRICFEECQNPNAQLIATSTFTFPNASQSVEILFRIGEEPKKGNSVLSITSDMRALLLSNYFKDEVFVYKAKEPNATAQYFPGSGIDFTMIDTMRYSPDDREQCLSYVEAMGDLIRQKGNPDKRHDEALSMLTTVPQSRRAGVELSLDGSVSDLLFPEHVGLLPDLRQLDLFGLTILFSVDFFID